MSTPPWRTRCSPASTLVATSTCQPSQGSAKADTTTCAWQALLSMKDADRHGDARLPAQLQEPYPAACRSRLPRGPGTGPGVASTLASLQFCARRVIRVARLPLCREVAHGAHNLEQYRAWRCSTVRVCAGQRRLGTRVFAPPGPFSRGLRPFGVLFLPQCACFRRAASCHAVVQRQPIPSSTHPHRAGLAVPGVQFRDITTRPCCRTPRCSAC